MNPSNPDRRSDRGAVTDPVVRTALLVVGCVCVGCAAVGVALPLIPVTPFVLAAAFCFARSSQRFDDYLTNHKIFGRYLRNYREGIMTPRDKTRTLILLWVSIVLSCWIADTTATWIVLPLIAAAVSVQILRLKPKR